MMNRKHVAVFVALWLFLSCAGLVAMLYHEKSPGMAGNPPGEWPANSTIAPRGPTLILFAHPHCPCTRASIGELAQIMAHCEGKLAAHVCFLLPAGQCADWTQSDLWRSAEAIPGVTVHIDWNGAEARRFHAGTSGQTVLYDAGRLLFAGGITAGRGHSGDNPGRDAVMALLASPTDGGARTPVYGCPLSRENGSDCRQSP
jgi:hypothetical protein